ncbi:Hsp70 family protein [Actinomycetospora endophytica]|uniref:Hsp70 family protein n=1 Tax=Actinomycetospora endophytica TaxID=2291215 RepID=UPI0027E279BA|nr:Hsp70 family protein [Actinomycetospora endophytica]
MTNQEWAPRPITPLQPAAAAPRAETPYDLGVDLGTTFTAAAVRSEARPGAPDPTVRVVGLERGSVQVPSVLLVDDDGSLLVGGEAEARAPWAPQRVVREFKRRLGDATPIVVAGEGFSADGVAAEMVRWTADRVAGTHGAEPRRIAVAHPAGWGAYRRRVFTEALAEVGLHDVVLLTEPEAAAAAHAAAGRLPVGRTVAVYDLGGGTFDAAVVRGVPACPTAPVGLTVLGRGQGLEALGGIDFDEALFWHVCSELGGAVAALDPADPETVRAVAGLRRSCVLAKETLSVDTDAVVDVRLPNVTTRVRVTRGEFEEMIEPALRQTVDVLGEVLDSARVRAQDLDGVLLVGGSSRIPLVARMLSAELGRPVAVDPDPTTVVARGATWAAAAASGAVRPAAPTSGPFPAHGSGPFPAPSPAYGFPTQGSGPFPAPSPAYGLPAQGSGPFPAAPFDDEPRTDVVGRSAALLAHARHADPDDPMTTPVRLDLRAAQQAPEPPTPAYGVTTSALPPARPTSFAPAAPFEPPSRPDPRRRRLAIGAGAAAVLVVGGAVAVSVPMISKASSTGTATTAAAPAAPAGITAQPAAANAGTLPAGTLPGATDPTTGAATGGTTAKVANKAGTAAAPAPGTPAAAAAARPGTPVAPPVVPAAKPAAAPAAANPAPAPVPAPVKNTGGTPAANPGAGQPKSGDTTPPASNPPASNPPASTPPAGSGSPTTTTPAAPAAPAAATVPA